MIRRSGWTISTSMRGNKKVFSQLPRIQALALSALLSAPLGLAAVPGFVSSAPPPFNIVISNVPGPTRADVLGRRPARRQLPAVDRAGRAGAEHHHGQQRRQPRFRARRMPAKRAAPAAPARPPGRCTQRSGTRCRRLDFDRAPPRRRPGSTCGGWDRCARRPALTATTTPHAAGQLDHCLSTGADLYRHSPRHGELEVRPIRHRLPDRVRAQVFLRMLSCYLSWYLKQALAPILCHDHDEPAAAAQRRNPVRCGPAF